MNYNLKLSVLKKTSLETIVNDRDFRKFVPAAQFPFVKQMLLQ